MNISENLNCESIEMPFGKINLYRKRNDICKGVLLSGNYNKKFSDKVYNIYMGFKIEDADSTYRGNQMSRGIYLGHNLGSSCKMNIKDNNIYINVEKDEDYSKVFWSFILKYILTKASLDENVLHIKGSLIRGLNGELILLLGKGGSGKTTLGKMLQEFGYRIISNTHCLVKDDYIWGINSWTRIRNDKGQKYIEPPKNICKMDGKIKKCFIVNCNNVGTFNLTKVDEKYLYYYIRNFVSAINNYDLKEEVWDYMSENNISRKMDLFEVEDDLIKTFIRQKILLLSNDTLNNECLEKLLKVLSN